MVNVDPPSIQYLRSADGVRLAIDAEGAPDAPPVVFAHGFGQTRLAWSASARRLAGAGFRTVAFDARGHGDSDWLPGGGYAFPQFVDDLEQVTHHAGARPVLVGASMGGLLGIAAQAQRAPLFGALVLVDITPRWESAGTQRIFEFMRAYPDGFASLHEAADAIQAYLPQRRERKSPQRLASLLVDRGDGRLRWHWDPYLLETVARDSEQQQDLLAEAARRIDIPTLLISGGASELVSRATIDEFLALVPHARHVVVPHATHMVAGDANDAFTAHVTQFLQHVANAA